MDKGVLQMAGLVVAGIGMVGSFAVMAMPQWKVSAFIESNIIVFEVLWEGLWMSCYRQANIRMQCKIYDSILALTPDLQAGRALMVAATILSFLAFVVAILGMRCTNCAGNNERCKGIILLVAGIAFILSGILVVIPVSWTANHIIRDFYNPLVNIAQKREMGEAIYLGWIMALFLVVGGIILCCCFLCTETRIKYSLPPKVTSNPQCRVITRKSSSVYSRSQYV